MVVENLSKTEDEEIKKSYRASGVRGILMCVVVSGHAHTES